MSKKIKKDNEPQVIRILSYDDLQDIINEMVSFCSNPEVFINDKEIDKDDISIDLDTTQIEILDSGAITIVCPIQVNTELKACIHRGRIK